VSADIVNLASGGTLRGNVIADSYGSRAVAVRTSTGGLILLDPAAVKQVQRSSGPSASSPHKAAVPRATLTAAERAWGSKIRPLVAHVFGSDPDQRRRARLKLLEIQDRNAIPALSQSLAANSSEEARLLYVDIMKDMPGETTVFYLVAVSLYDPSTTVRDAARNAIGPVRADAARRMFIEALRSGDLDLASLAARGVGQIGDPAGDTVPSLIDSLVYRRAERVAVSRFGPSRRRESNCSPTRAIALTYGAGVPPCVRTITSDHANHAVLDALVKISDLKYPGFGVNVDQWRRWWALEKKNRDIQNGSRPRPEGQDRHQHST
jgi:hypothetical protein